MKKSILNLGTVLNKTEQKNINGSSSSCSYLRACYGVFDTPFIGTCGTCEEYNQLPGACKNRVPVSIRCFGPNI